MKLKVIFLLTSISITSKLTGSYIDFKLKLEQNTQAEGATQQNINVALPETNSKENNDTEQPSAIKTSIQGSTIFTKAFHGAAALIGKSRGTIFLDLYKNGTLEADLLTNAKLAEDRLRDAAEERCKNRDLQSPKNQSTIFKIFDAQHSLATKTKKSFILDSQRANEYNPLLGQALQAITLHHATVVQPQLNQKRIEEKAAADAAYEKEMIEVHLVFAAQTASNKRDLEMQATNKTNSHLQNEKHYESLASYEALLQSIRENNSKK